MADFLDTETDNFNSATYQEGLQDPDLPSEADVDPSTYKPEVPFHRRRLGAHTKPEQVPELSLSSPEYVKFKQNEMDKDSTDVLKADYLTNLYLAHIPPSEDQKSSEDQQDSEDQEYPETLDPEKMATVALSTLENKEIKHPIEESTSAAFVELITRAIKMLKTVEIAELKNKIFDVILKCSSILLNKDTTRFEELVIKLEEEQIMDFITRAIQMFKTVKEKDPTKEAYLKNNIFLFIYQCINILLEKKTISFEYALTIANEILDLIVLDVTKAFGEVNKYKSSEEKIRKLEDVQKKLEDAKKKYSIYLNVDQADGGHPGFLISVKENAQTDKNWIETDKESQLSTKLTLLKDSLTSLDRQINNKKMLAEKLAKVISTRESVNPSQLPGSVDPSPSSRSFASTEAQRRRDRSMSRRPTPEKKGGMTTRKKYRRRNKRKTKHYKKKAKRYTKKRNRRS